MSFLGAITVELKVSDNRVTAATVVPDKEVKVEKLLLEKAPAAAVDTISSLFTLCPKSQKAACEAALFTAEHGKLDAELSGRLSRQIQQERISEGFRFFVLQLPPASYREKNAKRIASVWKLISALGEAADNEEAWFENKIDVSNQLLPLLMEDFSDYWRQDLLNGMAEKDGLGVPAIFAKLAAHRYIGWATVPVFKKKNKVVLADIKHTGQKLEDMAAGPFNYVTGAVSRMRFFPTVNALLNSDADSAYTRFAARFTELLLDLTENLPAEQLVSSIALKDGSAASLVQNSRGMLLHSVELGEGKNGGKSVRSYCILTPTEINVTRSVSFLDSLVGLKARSEDEIKELAKLIVLSYDPCTEIRIAVSHA